MNQDHISSSFKQRLRIFDLTMIVVGAVIGSGIFLTPSKIVRVLGDPTLVMGIWILGGLMAIAGALTFAELANVLPKVGGLYTYLSEAYSPYVGFTYGWCMLLVMNSGSMAALCVACITYVSYFIPMSPAAMKVCSIGIIAFLTLTNYIGVKQGSTLSNIFSMTKIIGIAALIIAGILLPHQQSSSLAQSTLQSPTNLIAALAIAMVGVLWSYGGWQYATFPAGETKNASRTIPMSIFIGVGIILTLYISVNLVYMTVLPLEVMAHETRVASLTAEYLIGPIGGSIIAILIALSTFGTASVYALSAPRVYYAMANDGLFFKRVAQLHPKFGTPYIALVIQFVIVSIFILSGTFDELISYVAFVDWIFYALTAGAVFIFRKKFSTVIRNYKTLGYPVTPIFFILVSVWFVVYLFYNEPVKSGIGLCVLITSVPVYLYWRKRK